MYQHVAAPVGAVTAATLPFTGMSLIYVFLAGVALLAIGIALTRIAPKRQA